MSSTLLKKNLMSSWYFLVNFTNFFKTDFLEATVERLLLKNSVISVMSVETGGS